MTFESTAQIMGELMVEEAPVVLEPHPSGQHLVVYPEYPEQDVVMEMHEPSEEAELSAHEEPKELEIVVCELPGVEELDPEMEEQLEAKKEEKKDESEADDKKSKKAPKWDWEAKGAQGFIAWVKERCESVPKHSGYDTAGIERAISYLQKLDNEISKAMRMDLDGELDADKIEAVRAEIDDGTERLYARLDKIKGKKKKKADIENSLVKEAQKSPRISGVVITVPLLISRIARVCINSTVSAGHDIEEEFKKQAKLYSLTMREKAEVLQHLADLGFPMLLDRGHDMSEEYDPTSSDNSDFSATYTA